MNCIHLAQDLDQCQADTSRNLWVLKQVGYFFD